MTGAAAIATSVTVASADAGVATADAAGEVGETAAA